MRIAYVRVSTIEQNDARQVEALKKYDIEKWFDEKISGKNALRPQLRLMLDFCREGDVIYVHDLSRLVRNTRDLLEIVDKLEKKSVKLVSLKENIDTQTPTGRLMLTMIAAIAEFERQNLLERQREGITIAKAAGRYTGGHKKIVPPEKWETALRQYQSREINKTQMAARLDVSRPTLDRMLADARKRAADHRAAAALTENQVAAFEPVPDIPFN